jgi:hypothetical protein
MWLALRTPPFLIHAGSGGHFGILRSGANSFFRLRQRSRKRHIDLMVPLADSPLHRYDTVAVYPNSRARGIDRGRSAESRSQLE